MASTSPDSLSGLVEAAAARAPGALAVRDGTRALSYAELATGMRGLAARLAAAGVTRGDRVGVLIPKSLESVFALLGAMRAGAAYVPVDPGAPTRRAKRILTDAGVAALVTTAAELAKRPGLLDDDDAPRPRLVVLAGETGPGAPAGAVPLAPLLAGPGAGAVPPPPDEQELAYILYTSGSTGDPKGVMLTHGNALAFVRWAAAETGLTAEDRLSSHAPFHFDLSVFDLYAAFLAGASVWLVPDALSYFPLPLGKWIAEHGISVWYSVPSVLGKLATSGALSPAPPRLRVACFAGEVFALPPLRALQQALPGVALYNWYGPTETNVCTSHRVEAPLAEDRRDPLPIGAPCPYADVLVVAEDGTPTTAVGGTGELWVRGASTLRGYWNDEARTARALARDPRPDAPEDARYYRTGDDVRWLPDGQFAFLGRRDSMVKARGYRIELGDVESALHEHAAVDEAAALVVPDGEGGSRLHAAAVLRAGATASPGDLQRHCLGIVPRYMVPESILLLPELPRTSTGKVDRVTLASRFTPSPESA